MFYEIKNLIILNPNIMNDNTILMIVSCTFYIIPSFDHIYIIPSFDHISIGVDPYPIPELTVLRIIPLFNWPFIRTDRSLNLGEVLLQRILYSYNGIDISQE